MENYSRNPCELHCITKQNTRIHKEHIRNCMRYTRIHNKNHKDSSETDNHQQHKYKKFLLFYIDLILLLLFLTQDVVQERSFIVDYYGKISHDYTYLLWSMFCQDINLKGVL